MINEEEKDNHQLLEFETKSKVRSAILSLMGLGIVALIFIFTTIWVTRSADKGTASAVDIVSEFYVEEFATHRVNNILDEIQRNYKYIENAINQITPEDLKSKYALRSYLKKIRKFYGIESFSFVGENNIVYTGNSTTSISDHFSFVSEGIVSPGMNTANFYGAQKSIIISHPVEGIYFDNSKIIGCFARIDIEKIVNSMSLYSDGSKTYCALFYRNGESLTSKNFGNIEPGKNILSVIGSGQIKDNKSVNDVVSDFNNQKYGSVHLVYNGEEAFLYYVPVEGTNWMLTILVYDNVISGYINNISSSIMFRNRIQIGITVITILILFIFLIMMMRKNSKLRVEQEQKVSSKIKEAYQKLNEEIQAMNIIHGVLDSGPWNMEFDEGGKMVSCHWSDEFRNMIGYSSMEDFPDKNESFTKLIHEDDKSMVEKSFWNSVNDYSGKTIYDVECRVLTKNNGWRWFHAAGSSIRRNDGSPVAMIGLFTDIDEKKRTEIALNEQFYMFAALGRDYKNIYRINPKKDTLEVLKLDGYVTEGIDKNNPQKILSYEKILTNYINKRVYKEDIEFLTDAMSLKTVIKKLEKCPEYVSSYRVVDKGHIHFYQFKYMLLEDGMIIAAFNNIDDVVKAAKERETLKTLSETDLMTGLLNRGSGEGKVTEALGKGEGGFFCLLDIDNFKYYNDNFGHEAGDKVIISIAHCLRKAFREGDVVFRLGGDEFSAYAPRVQNETAAEKILKRFIENIKKLDIPDINGTPITTSIGATIIPKGESVEFAEKYKLVDNCVYESKKTQGFAVTFK